MEVMVAGAILAGLAMVATQLNTNIMGSIKRLETKSEEIELINQLRLQLSSKPACTFSFGGTCDTDSTITDRGKCSNDGGNWKPGTRINPSATVSLKYLSNPYKISEIGSGNSRLITKIRDRNGNVFLESCLLKASLCKSNFPKSVIGNGLIIIKSMWIAVPPAADGGIPNDNGEQKGKAKVVISYIKPKTSSGGVNVLNILELGNHRKDFDIFLETDDRKPSTCLTADEIEVFAEDATYMKSLFWNNTCGGCNWGSHGEVSGFCNPTTCGAAQSAGTYIRRRCSSVAGSGSSPNDCIYNYTVSCEPGDQAVAGDCGIRDADLAHPALINSGGTVNIASTGVTGDFSLDIPSGTRCDNCPNGPICDAACINQFYTGFTCYYSFAVHNMMINATSNPGARIVCAKRFSSSP